MSNNTRTPPLPPNGTRNRYRVEVQHTNGACMVQPIRNTTLEDARSIVRDYNRVNYYEWAFGKPQPFTTRIVARDAQGRKLVLP